MGQKFTITESERNQIRGLYEQSIDNVVKNTTDTGTVQTDNIDIKQVIGILKSKGLTQENFGQYKLYMVKNSNGPIQNKDGSYVWNYEAYIPIKPGNQLWIGKRRKDIKNPDGVPESSYIVITLSGPTHKILYVNNGKTVKTEDVDTQTAMNFINSYQAKF
jgi:hypothetical protein